MSPRVLTVGPYNFHFVMYDCNERMHVHVYSGKKPGRNQVKVWLMPEVELAWSRGFRQHEVGDILGHIADNRDMLIELWKAICGD